MPVTARESAGPAPSAEQELLLRAALLEGDAAREAYRLWCARTDIEHLDEGSYRLLPQLGRNLLRLGLDASHRDDPVARRLTGVLRHTWSGNQVTLRLAQASVDRLAAAGIIPLVLPEVSLLQYYGHLGARPVESLKLFVPEHGLSVALPVLGAQGWGPLPRLAGPALHGALTGFRLDLGDQRLDLVARVLPNCASAETDDRLLAGAGPSGLGVSGARTLWPGDELLYTCRRAAQWDDIPAFRWLADGFTVVANGGIADWDRVLAQAERYDVSLALAESARYLAEALGAPIPASVWQRAAAGHPGWLARLDHRVRSRRPGALGRLPLLVLAFMQGHRSASLARRLRALPGFLQREWRLGSRTQVGRYLLGGARRVRRRARPGT
jgi:putative nucleotidyltransferase-like protein